MFWNSAAQGANLQLARKSTHLPKCLLILKGLSGFFLGGANSRSHGFVWAEKSRSGVLVTNSKMPTIVTWSECERLLSCYCYATKTNSRTIPEQVSQPASAGKGADMSELQSHHCVFEQINDIGTAVHGHLQLFLKCRLPNHISFDIFDRCFCKVETRACETLRSSAQRLGGPAVTTLPGAWRSLNQVLRPGGWK